MFSHYIPKGHDNNYCKNLYSSYSGIKKIILILGMFVLVLATSISSAEVMQRNDEPTDPDLPGPARTSKPPGKCTYEYKIELWKSDALFKGSKLDHTATRTIYNRTCEGNKKSNSHIDRCNHGGCPGDLTWKGEDAAIYGPVPQKQIGQSINQQNQTAGKMNKVYTADGLTSNHSITPYGCDYYVERYKPDWIKDLLNSMTSSGNRRLMLVYGAGKGQHVCNQDSFIQIATIMTGKEPNLKDIDNICNGSFNYNRFTGLDIKNYPSLSGVKKYIEKYDWGKFVSGGAGPATKLQKRQN